jgi:outer membrane protein assembly factor BamB
VIAFTVGGGRVLWKRTIGPSESSPLVAGDLVYVGDWDGRVWALQADTGKTRWVAKLRSQVKGGVALSGGRVYIGDYSGHLYALNAKSGRVVWDANVQPRFGSAGNFYATPTLAYGRVYIGATDGKLYSFGATSGKLRWSQSTGGYVYSSAAVWRKRVFVGSYSKRFYAMDAATGRILWQFQADGPISGSPTVIAGRVYFATLNGTTYALNARTGRRLWTYPDGKYSPVVADADRLYLTGYTRVYALEERRAAGRRGVVSVAAFARVMRGYHRVIVGRRYASAAAASKHSGVQVCNVVVHKKPGAAPDSYRRAVKALRARCRP